MSGTVLTMHKKGSMLPGVESSEVLSDHADIFVHGVVSEATQKSRNLLLVASLGTLLVDFAVVTIESLAGAGANVRVVSDQALRFALGAVCFYLWLRFCLDWGADSLQAQFETHIAGGRIEKCMAVIRHRIAELYSRIAQKNEALLQWDKETDRILAERKVISAQRCKLKESYQTKRKEVWRRFKPPEVQFDVIGELRKIDLEEESDEHLKALEEIYTNLEQYDGLNALLSKPSEGHFDAAPEASEFQTLRNLLRRRAILSRIRRIVDLVIPSLVALSAVLSSFFGMERIEAAVIWFLGFGN